MLKYRIEKGSATIDISEVNRLNDLAKDLKDQELTLKAKEVKLETEYRAKEDKLVERELEINKLIKDNMLVGVSNIALETRRPIRESYEYYSNFTRYSIIDEDLKSKILLSNLETISSFFVTNFDNVKFLNRLQPNEVYKCFDDAVEQATGIKLD